MSKNLKHTILFILIVITLLPVVVMSLAASKSINQNEIKGTLVPLDPIVNGKWSDLGMNLFPSENSYVDTILDNGFTEFRHLINYRAASATMANSKAMIIRAIAKGAKIIWGVSAPTPITASNRPDFHAAILAAAQWAQDNGVYEFQLGNEEEYHVDGTTMTVAQIRLNMKSTAAEVQNIFTRGNVSYACAADTSAISEWKTLGRGSIDIISWNLYIGGTTFNDGWKTKINNIIKNFGVDHTYLSEFNLSFLSLDSYSTDETVQAAKISEMIDYIKASGMTRAYYFHWKGDQGAVKDDGTYRLLWDVLSSSNDLTAAMTANSAPSPNVVSASAEAGDTYAYMAFDHNKTGDNKWLTNATNGWLKFDFGSALYTITKYTILAPDEAGNESRLPKNWTFEGSNNDSTWTTLDTQTNQTFAAHERKTYTSSNATPYRYYRLNISANGGDAGWTAIQEMQMMNTQGVKNASKPLQTLPKINYYLPLY